MPAIEAPIDEYLDEIRKQVCTRCVERPPEGPPCVPLGVNCGVELHLPELIHSIHQVKHTNLIAPYQDHNRSEICENCAFHGSSCCPCPMDYLIVLIAQAVETVDERIAERVSLGTDRVLPHQPGIDDVRRVYAAATARWKGCDWPTRFGQSKLDLNGYSAEMARARLRTAATETQVEDWAKAASWLADVEREAHEAETAAAQALAAAERGQWEKALGHAERAWAAEFGTGRPVWHSFPAAWQELREVVGAIFLSQAGAKTDSDPNHREKSATG